MNGPRPGNIGLDFEFVSFDDLTPARELKTRFALSMGTSKRIQQTRKGKTSMHWNIAHDQAEIRRTFMAIHVAGGGRGQRAITSAQDMLMASNSAATPAAGHWLAALKALEEDTSAFDNVAKELAKNLSNMEDKLVGKISLKGYRVVGSYLRDADMGGGYVQSHTTGPYRAGTTDLWNQAHEQIGGSLNKIADSLGVSGGRDGNAFRLGITGDVVAGLEGGGVSNTAVVHDPNIWFSGKGKYSDKPGIRKGYTGMEDLFLMTGGKEAHKDFVTKRMRQGGNSDWEWGKGGYASHGHGATFDAVLSESIYEKLEAGLTDEQIAKGRKLVVENRVNAAKEYVKSSDVTMPHSPSETITDSVKTEGTGQSTGTTSKKRSNMQRMNTAYQDYGKKFKASDYASSLRRSRASQYMKGKWGWVAGVAAAGLLVGVASDEFYRNSQRRQMDRAHISSEKLSQAMSLGGSR